LFAKRLPVPGLCSKAIRYLSRNITKERIEFLTKILAKETTGKIEGRPPIATGRGEGEGCLFDNVAFGRERGGLTAT
jgi:hypothetical protein